MTTHNVRSRRFAAEMTLTEYAAAVGVNRRTAMAWAHKGRIRARRTHGGHWRVDAGEVDGRDLSPRQYAAAVGVCERTALRWAESGKLAARQPVPGGTWAIRFSEVERIRSERRADCGEREVRRPATRGRLGPTPGC